MGLHENKLSILESILTKGATKNLTLINKLLSELKDEYKKINYINNIEVVNENLLLTRNIPYPQANDVKKMFALIYYIHAGYTLTDELSEVLRITPRQIDYYGNALVYLEFVHRSYGMFLLTDKGSVFKKSSKDEKIKLFIDSCLALPSIRQCYIKFITENNFKKSMLSQILQKHGVIKSNNINVINRRGNCIYKWLKFIDSEIIKLV